MTQVLSARALEEAMEKLFPDRFFVNLSPAEQSRVINMARAIAVLAGKNDVVFEYKL